MTWPSAFSARDKSRYTNSDIADLVMEVHSCLHTVEGKVDTIKAEVGRPEALPANCRPGGAR
ncbi:hypothetical protein [Phenylobacterium sp.]|uniref:hypothetical protein n=1 Tax=Phenylobacterium sp. TaxID=1871053 RepID=UPI003BAA7182